MRFILGLISLFVVTTAFAHVCDNSTITITNSTSNTIEITGLKGEGISGVTVGSTIAPGGSIIASSKSAAGRNDITFTLLTHDSETITFTTHLNQPYSSTVCTAIIPACPCFLKISNKDKYSFARRQNDGIPAQVDFTIIEK